MIMREQINALPQRPQVACAFDPLSGFPRRVDCRKQNRREKADNADNHQQFQKGEAVDDDPRLIAKAKFLPHGLDTTVSGTTMFVRMFPTAEEHRVNPCE